MAGWKRVFGIIWTGQLISTLSSSIVGYAVVFWLSIPCACPAGFNPFTCPGI